MRIVLATAFLVAIGSATAWSQAPAAGSGGGGPVGASVSSPTAPTGATPPGTPGVSTVPDQIARDNTGQSVIGKTTNPPGAVPGNTGAQGTGVTK